MVTVTLFETFERLNDWSDKQLDKVIISEETPLLSNLNMLENIALISEVHQRLSIQEAEKNAFSALAGLQQEKLAFKRVNKCNDIEIFTILLLRAKMMQVEKIFIILPLSLISHNDAIAVMLKIIQQVQPTQMVEILDLKSNRNHYQGQLCHINE